MTRRYRARGDGHRVRTWGASGAGAVIRRAQAASNYARHTGCPLDEAAEMVDGAVTRRRFLVGAGAAAVAAMLPGALSTPAGADADRTRHRETSPRDRKS